MNTSFKHSDGDREGYRRLLYRNQFVLGPDYLDFPGWRTVSAGPGVCVTSHPDLPCHRAVEGERRLTLLGFMLDPENEARTDSDIVNGLLGSMSSARELVTQTEKYGGRWVLIADDGEETLLLHDAGGLRQVFYSVAGDRPGVWCASQPEMLARLLGLEMDPAALGLINSLSFRRNPEYWWPGSGTPYREVKHLLPNHVLNLATGEVRRYWPDAELPELPLDEAVERIAAMLTGIIRSAARRFDLALAMTAGWDSRLALAGSSEVKDRLSFMTVRQLSMSDDHPDLKVPAALLSRLGLPHEIVRCGRVADPEFRRVLKMNYVLAHDHYASDAEAIWKRYGLRTAVLTASVAEIARDPTVGSERSIAGRISVHEISQELFETGCNRYAIEQIEQYLASIGPRYNVSLDSIFYWEQRVGNWIAMNQLEFDAAWQEIVTPFNCRRLLVDMLSVQPRQRLAPRNILHRRLIERLWPELLTVPVNPHKTSLRWLAGRCLGGARRMVRRWPLFRPRRESGEDEQEVRQDAAVLAK